MLIKIAKLAPAAFTLWAFAFSAAAADLTLTNPLAPKGLLSTEAIVGQVIRNLIGLMGVVALVMIVWAGFTWTTAAGNPDKVKKAKTILVWTILGVAAVLASYLILSTVFEIFGQGGAPAPPGAGTPLSPTASG